MWLVLRYVCGYAEAVTAHTRDPIGSLSAREEATGSIYITSSITCLRLEKSCGVPLRNRSPASSVNSLTRGVTDLTRIGLSNSSQTHISLHRP
jgi:hypothetical protein